MPVPVATRLSKAEEHWEAVELLRGMGIPRSDASEMAFAYLVIPHGRTLTDLQELISHARSRRMNPVVFLVWALPQGKLAPKKARGKERKRCT